MITDYDRELNVAVNLARAAGGAILAEYEKPLHVEQKNLDDDVEPVTQADRIANELIVNGLKKEFPADGILAEESVDTERRLRKSRVWMVDPLDGTNGFIDGNGDFAVQIGLVEDGECVVAAVYLPIAHVLYRAVAGDGAWIERPQRALEQAHVSGRNTFATMRLAASRSHRSPRMNKVVQRFGFQEEVQRGSVGIKVGLLVEQQSDVYIHLSPRTKQWDTCAPQLILTEAGGRLTDLFGRPLNYNVPDVNNRNGLVASNGVSHDLIIETLAPLLAEFGRLPIANSQLPI
ncbi:MAG TPA: 3'(2'),5'-bisphosphate nucleotidase CysQ [Pyrinomonadaceae bacterium]|nr:3'(2'),5'-bisphosphate nucleotidase CysQ [Pyrinomonadaceae bacterium]